jgi:hypothetical protein
VATFNYVGNVQRQFTVPPMVTSLNFEAVGGGGGNGSSAGGANRGTGGVGGVTAGTLSVTPGEVLVLCVGERGGDGGAAGQAGGYDQFSGGSGGGGETEPFSTTAGLGAAAEQPPS